MDICSSCTEGSEAIAACCQQETLEDIGGCFDSYVKSGSDTDFPVSAAPSSYDLNAHACLDAALSVQVVAVAFPSFRNLPYTQQVSCLCYDDFNNFVPTSFDNVVSSCYSYLETADPANAPAYGSGLLGFCAASPAAPLLIPGITATNLAPDMSSQYQRISIIVTLQWPSIGTANPASAKASPAHSTSSPTLGTGAGHSSEASTTRTTSATGTTSGQGYTWHTSSPLVSWKGCFATCNIS